MLGVEFIMKAFEFIILIGIGVLIAKYSDFFIMVISNMILICIGVLIYPIYFVLEVLASCCRGILYIFGLPTFSTVWCKIKNFFNGDRD